MSSRQKHLLHLAAWAVLLYAFAFMARMFGATIAFAILLPAGILVELAFWVALFRPRRR